MISASHAIWRATTTGSGVPSSSSQIEFGCLNPVCKGGVDRSARASWHMTVVTAVISDGRQHCSTC